MKISFLWNASDGMRKAETIATGQPAEQRRQTPAEFSDLDKDQRAAVLDLVAVDELGKTPIDLTFTWAYDRRRHGAGIIRRPLYFDAAPTIADLIAAIYAQIRSQAAAEAEYKAEEKDRRDADIERSRAKDAEQERRLTQISEAQARLDVAIVAIDTADDDDERAAALAELDALATVTDPQANQRRKKSKEAWIALYGSDHLKRATAAGYDSQRRYVAERAAKDAPGWTLDFDGSHKWQNRSDPSPAALDAEEEAAKLAETLPGDTQTAIVWLTAPGTNEADPNEREAAAWNFDPREAVTIDGYLGRYTLIRSI